MANKDEPGDETRETARRVFMRGLKIDAEIGVYPEEVGRRQPISVSIDLDVVAPDGPTDDRFDQVVCYNRVSNAARDIASKGHIKLVETLAERILDHALDHPMVVGAAVRVEKLTAVDGADAAGVEIRREKSALRRG
ncbi:MAG: dihydroneopterin aldolase [Parvularculaceae bacterium]